ncbi:olfactory receptor 52P1-like [Petromyzon marinus]|uniref:Olfactory receptor n=1 Tax=Petromyzon marinus TaxID=7757 RepID=A0AAJ7UEV1_PETMA|nr:putative olfactory receptor 52P1 [Petromyzon marinus]
MSTNASSSSFDYVYMESPFQGLGNGGHAFFAFFLLVYAATLTGNSLLLTVIITDRSLRRPMYVMLANLVTSDLIGSTATLPRIMCNIVASNAISLPECFAQMFFTHVYGVLSSFSLSAMTVDRYLAICQPLRYHTLMHNARALKVNAALASVSVMLILIMMLLIVRHSFCKEMVIHMPHCDHMTMVALACDDVTANEFYDLITKLLGLGGCLAIVLVAYLRIAFECRQRATREGQAKAVRTVVTHLLVVLIFFMSGLLIVVVHRLQKVFNMPVNVIVYLVVNFHTLPALMNPIIYGLCSADIRRAIARLVRRRVGPAE